MANKRAVMIMPMSVLNTSNKTECDIKKLIIDSNLLSAVILCPNNMFESTQIPVCILVFDKGRETQRVQMIDAREFCEQEVRDQRGQFGGASHEGRIYHKTLNAFSDEQISEIVKAVNKGIEKEMFSKAVSLSEIKSNDYNLKPQWYLQQKTEPAKHREYSLIADDYNSVVRKKNQIKLTLNETAAKTLGINPEIYKDKTDISDSFKIAGVEAEKENYMHFTKHALIKIEVKTGEALPWIISDFIRSWSLLERELNDRENVILAEFRDALMNDLLRGEIEIK